MALSCVTSCFSHCFRCVSTNLSSNFAQIEGSILSSLDKIAQEKISKARQPKIRIPEALLLPKVQAELKAKKLSWAIYCSDGTCFLADQPVNSLINIFNSVQYILLKSGNCVSYCVADFAPVTRAYLNFFQNQDPVYICYDIARPPNIPYVHRDQKIRYDAAENWSSKDGSFLVDVSMPSEMIEYHLAEQIHTEHLFTYDYYKKLHTASTKLPEPVQNVILGYLFDRPMS